MNATAEERRLHVHKGESISAQETSFQVAYFATTSPSVNVQKKISVMFNLDELSRRLFKIRHLC